MVQDVGASRLALRETNELTCSSGRFLTPILPGTLLPDMSHGQISAFKELLGLRMLESGLETELCSRYLAISSL